MFPTLVWNMQLAPDMASSINASVVDALNGMRGEQRPLERGAGWQSEQTLHSREDMQLLMSCCRRAVHGVIKFLKIGCDELEITGCWGNVLAAGASHRAH